MPLEKAAPIGQMGTVWNYRLVVRHKYREEIDKRMEESGLKSDDKGWIQKFQQTVSEVILSIGGEDTAKELYGPVAKAWNETEPPEDVKRR